MCMPPRWYQLLYNSFSHKNYLFFYFFCLPSVLPSFLPHFILIFIPGFKRVFLIIWWSSALMLSSFNCMKNFFWFCLWNFLIVIRLLYFVILLKPIIDKQFQVQLLTVAIIKSLLLTLRWHQFKTDFIWNTFIQGDQ